MALDFLNVLTRPSKGITEIYPDFRCRKTKDLMIRGNDFYAIWDAANGCWSTEIDRAIELIDNEIAAVYAEEKDKYGGALRPLYLSSSQSKSIDDWYHYIHAQAPNNYHNLDETVYFANDPVSRDQWSSKRVPYALAAGDISAYDRMMSVLYAPAERHKLEWAIGSIVCGASKKLEKFIVLYGASGTGKSTVINLIDSLFPGYCASFDAKALGSASNQFALEPFRTNPLVAVQHDGDLSRIEDNTRLNSLVSHEEMIMNEKHKTTYPMRFNAFLIMGTNTPVRITDSKSGLTRRLIDVSPTGNLIPPEEYWQLREQIEYELGAIAQHCKEVFLEDPRYYDKYVPLSMMGASNDFYNFMLDAYYVFRDAESTTLKEAWDMYKNYVEEAKVPYPYTLRVFKEELKSYFKDYVDVGTVEGKRVRSYYKGFRTDRFEAFKHTDPQPKTEEQGWLIFDQTVSILDKAFADCKAQYAKDDGTPLLPWKDVTTTLSAIDTSQLHYVLPNDVHHIVIDFDLKENGVKSFERNRTAALALPPTYAELSKSGQGIHLHYLYSGDPKELSNVLDDNVEIKVFTGLSSLRRRLTKCNGLEIATISSGLPKKEKKVLNFDGIKDQKHLRALIAKALRKEVFPNTKPSIDFIKKILDDAYASGMPYDVSDLRGYVTDMAMGSTNNMAYCLQQCQKMQWCSKQELDDGSDGEAPIVIFDTEVGVNIFLIRYAFLNDDPTIYTLLNPSPQDVEKFMRYRLVGYNNLRYDNTMLYARYLGESFEQLHDRSRRIIKLKDKTAIIRESRNVSYADLYEILTIKQSLKKWEVDLGLPHDEMDIDWDQPIPEELWPRLVEYCGNDVVATKEVLLRNKADWDAHMLLAEWAEMRPNSTTNMLTVKLVTESQFGHPEEMNWRNLGDVSAIASRPLVQPNGLVDEFTAFDAQNRPIFPGYTFEYGKSFYRGEDPKEGGYVYAEPGMYIWIALLDIASMHPTSAIAEKLFGKYTKNFEAIKELRIAIKHGDYDRAKQIAPAKVAKYLEDESLAEMLANALKIAINAVYGLTSAKFENAFYDPRNRDNIVAKRGALFMINLKHAVQTRGYTVVHIKTDSIKIANADMQIIEFVQEYGKLYGYTFEHEATYAKICLVNDSVYIAKYATVDECISLYGEDYVMSAKDVVKKCKKHPGQWTATGKEFAIPYIFKTLFTHEEITLDDLNIVQQSKTGNLYLGKDESRTFIGKIGQFSPVANGRPIYAIAVNDEGKETCTGVGVGYNWVETKDVTDPSAIDRTYFVTLAEKSYEKIESYAIAANLDMAWFLS